MVQLDEIYDGEIISLKKRKNGIVTIKIQTNNKQGGLKNEFIGNFGRKLGGTSGRAGNNPGSVLRKPLEDENSGRTPGGENRESGSSSGKEIPSSEGSSN